ncbi:MAG: hypothetical protein JWO69_903 [Thermoleophilia bacterium]|nr:hypothetical protein [Thermoleophilia bacterium]
MRGRLGLLALLMLLVTLVATGCGSDADDQPKDATPNTPSATEPSDPPEEEPAADDGDGGGAGVAALQVDVRATGGTGAPTASLALACPVDHFANNDVRAACTLLADEPAVLDGPDPAAGACPAVEGEPQTATVTGTLDGEAIDATFTRTDTCAVERWDAAAPLFTAAGYTD